MSNRGVAIDRTVLKDARLRKGWSLRAVSAATAAIGPRVSASNISSYERGGHSPHPWTLLSLATVLEVSVDDLRIKETAA